MKAFLTKVKRQLEDMKPLYDAFETGAKTHDMNEFKRVANAQRVFRANAPETIRKLVEIVENMELVIDYYETNGYKDLDKLRKASAVRLKIKQLMKDE